MRTLPQDDDLLAALLEQHRPRKRRGCVGGTIEFLCTVAVVALAVCGGYFLLVIYVGGGAAPGGSDTMSLPPPTVFSAPKTQPRQQPVIAPAPLPDCATVQDTTTACEKGTSTIGTLDPTPTAAPTPTPTAEGFWTQEELASFTATAEAFYDPATIPTAPPAFVQAVQEGCQDPTKVAQSKLLATWCSDE